VSLGRQHIWKLGGLLEASGMIVRISWVSFNLGNCYRHTIMDDITQRRACEPCTYASGFDPKSYTDKDLESLLEDSNLSEDDLEAEDPVEEGPFVITRVKHCFVEAPTRGGNLHRFRVTTHDCRGQIELHAYFWDLNEDAQAWVGGIDVLGFGRCIISKDVLKVSVEVSVDGDLSVLIIGTRRDVDDLTRMHLRRLGQGTGGVKLQSSGRLACS
jgi:hypothetical protein